MFSSSSSLFVAIVRKIASMQELPLFFNISLFILFSEYRTHALYRPPLKGESPLSAIDQYIKQITDLLRKTEDIELLDLIHKLLVQEN